RTDGDDPGGAGLAEDYPRSPDRPTRADYVVDYEDVPALHLQFRRFDLDLPRDPVSLLGELDEHRLKEGGEGFRPLGTTEVWGDHDRLIQLEVLLHVADQARDRRDAVDGNREERETLGGVDVDGGQARDASGAEEVGDVPETHHLPGDELLILPRVGQVRNHGVDLRPLLAQAVGGEKQLEEVLVGGRVRRLNNQDCLSGDFLLESESCFPIREDLDLVGEEWQAESPRDRFAQLLRRGAGEDDLLSHTFSSGSHADGI